MDLIDRYLVAVRRNLPPTLQQDIVEELADSLRSEAEVQAEQAGRPLTETDQAELLKKRGHPWLLASRYLPQQHLVGPALYPYYRRALVMVLFWLVLPITLIGGAMASVYSSDADHTWARTLSAAWNGAIYSVGIVTIVFAVLENQRVRLTSLESWDPLRLPAPRDGRAVPRTETLFNLVFTITFLLFWTGTIPVPEMANYAGMAVRFEPDPVWAVIHLPIVITVLVSIALGFVDLMRPWRTRLFSAILVVNNVAAIVILAVAWRAGHWTTVVAPVEFAAQAARSDRWINLSIEWTLIVIAAITLFETLREVRHMVTSRKEAWV